MATSQRKKKELQKNDPPEAPTSVPQALPEPIELKKEIIERIQRWLPHSRDGSIRVEIKDGVVYLQGITLGELQHRVEMFEMIGVTDPDLQKFLGRQVTRSFRDGVPYREMTEDGWKEVNSMAGAMLQALGPRDAIEGMLTLQMVTIHNMSMELLKRSGYDDQTFDAGSYFVNAATKMMRLFLMQVETLRKYRGQGQQQVIVKHVNVNAGGQAVVGHIEAGRKDAHEDRP
jgi:hypothetical protein